MAALPTGQTQQPTYQQPTSFAPGVSAGVRQALALVGGAVETNQTIRREARFIERREPAPFASDKVDIRTDGQEADKPEPQTVKKPPEEFRKLSLTGQPAADQDPGRGNLVDIQT